MQERKRGSAAAAGREAGRNAFATAVTTLGAVLLAIVFLRAEWGVATTAFGPTPPQAVSRPAVVHTGGGSYVFAANQPGDEHTPVAYDPCVPIHVVVNSRLAPPHTARLVTGALSRISETTGLRFVRGGATDRLPSDEPASAPADDPGGHRATDQVGDWPPVLIAWTTPEQVPGLRGDVAGLGGSTSVTGPPDDRSRYVTGNVSLDAPALAALLGEPHGRARVRGIVLHELGHLVGLDHVSDPGELMHYDNVGQTRLGPGDLEGLAALGRAGCS